MKHSYLLVGITSGKLGKLLHRNGISFTPKTMARVLFLFQSSIWASIFKKVERRKFKNKLKTYKMPADPVFIIGHWRTGSTFLHQLMSLDEQMVTPSVFQVSVPDSFLVSEKYYKPVMTKMMSPTRPMDNVVLGFYEPQEDEYALIKVAPESPLEKLIFPKSSRYFLSGYHDYMPTAENHHEWKSKFYDFCRRLSYSNGKRVLLKNPFHSMRIPLLREMYPKAKFIHIHRHPYKVVPSTIHMWKTVGKENKLSRKRVDIHLKEVAEVLNRMLNYIRKQFETIPNRMKTEVGFKDLQAEPILTIKKIYEDLELPFTNDFENKLNKRLLQLKSYQKNNYHLTEKDKETIKSLLLENFKHYNYKEINA
jgi:hypothetical protein